MTRGSTVIGEFLSSMAFAGTVVSGSWRGRRASGTTEVSVNWTPANHQLMSKRCNVASAPHRFSRRTWHTVGGSWADTFADSKGGYRPKWSNIARREPTQQVRCRIPPRGPGGHSETESFGEAANGHHRHVVRLGRIATKLADFGEQGLDKFVGRQRRMILRRLPETVIAELL